MTTETTKNTKKREFHGKQPDLVLAKSDKMASGEKKPGVNAIKEEFCWIYVVQ